ncbi:hypothetical protein FE374_00090 [Georgenia yuyongxinii]|uniref:Uncharacterized protein n=1 Tax=Georgenia yuyongxinii TaxID=2589797 RepID=A0A5B8C5G8_9MICO|nr:hypothetical protein [Georgenia yuyongxinii]QDC23246.1 hypothetical protein FE374_00090 [Georgenia yuyongxinii]
MVETASWLVVFTDPADLVLALYLRDAAGLDVAQDFPPLDGHVPRWDARWDTRQRRAAQTQWLSWWEDLLDHRPDDRDVRVDGPDFPGSAGTPELQAAQVALFPAALRWQSVRRAQAGALGTGTTFSALHTLGMLPLVKEIEARLGRPASAFRYVVEVVPTTGKHYWDLGVERLLISDELGMDLESLADVLRPRLGALA